MRVEASVARDAGHGPVEVEGALRAERVAARQASWPWSTARLVGAARTDQTATWMGPEGGLGSRANADALPSSSSTLPRGRLVEGAIAEIGRGGVEGTAPVLLLFWQILVVMLFVLFR